MTQYLNKINLNLNKKEEISNKDINKDNKSIYNNIKEGNDNEFEFELIDKNTNTNKINKEKRETN